MTTTPREPFPARLVRKGSSYPDREQLDTANMRFRRALSRLWKESQRSPDVANQLAPIIAEAARVLSELAGRAEQAEANSARNKADFRKRAQKGSATIRKAIHAAEQRGREPNPRAVEMLARLDGMTGDDD
ncbi:hypothetical protein [Streptomyces sp. NBC_01506]|uniref:hypothetical protein n=1 Tax=Streptomyces sp. NBC_01506 TaxID=2903887 RepID=UPI003867458E